MNISGFPGEKDGEVVQHVFLNEQSSGGENLQKCFETAYLMSTVSTELGCSKGRAYAAETAGF